MAGGCGGGLFGGEDADCVDAFGFVGLLGCFYVLVGVGYEV